MTPQTFLSAKRTVFPRSCDLSPLYENEDEDENENTKQQTTKRTALRTVLFCVLRSGAGGNRTLVQTRKSYAFYMLIFAFGFRAQARPKPPTCTLSSKVSPMMRGHQQLSPTLLHHHIDELRKQSVRVMSRFSTLCRNKAYLLCFD